MTLFYQDDGSLTTAATRSPSVKCQLAQYPAHCDAPTRAGSCLWCPAFAQVGSHPEGRDVKQARFMADAVGASRCAQGAVA